MKAINFFILVFVTALSSACSEYPVVNKKVEAAIDSIRGRYKFISATFSGPAIDLNDDGICSNNIEEELKSYSTCSIAFPYSIIVHASILFDEYYASQFVPFQNMNFEMESGLYIRSKLFGT